MSNRYAPFSTARGRERTHAVVPNDSLPLPRLGRRQLARTGFEFPRTRFRRGSFLVVAFIRIRLSFPFLSSLVRFRFLLRVAPFVNGHLPLRHHRLLPAERPQSFFLPACSNSLEPLLRINIVKSLLLEPSILLQITRVLLRPQFRRLHPLPERVLPILYFAPSEIE